tara:strand:+ start:6352 stop:6756 length:405 start_codon:yes stop_codon:yes gene_type:complete
MELSTNGKGFYEITKEVESLVKEHCQQKNAIVLISTQHTSASLCMQEAYDPSAKEDMQTFLDRLVPDNQAWHKHTLEGPDDTTAHLKSILTGNHLHLAVQEGRWLKGQWQGIYLCEHRNAAHTRTILLSFVLSS